MCVTQNILLVFTCKRVQLCSGNFSFLGLGKSKEVGSMHFDTDNVLYFKKKKKKKKILTVFYFYFIFFFIMATCSSHSHLIIKSFQVRYSEHEN